MKHAGGQVGGGGDRTRAREDRGEGAGWCGEPRACAWQWFARMRGLMSPVVEEVRGAAEGEGSVRGHFPQEFEEVDRLSMGEDVK